MAKQIFYFLYGVSMYLALAIVLLGLIRWSRLSKPLKVFVILQGTSFFCDQLAYVLISFGITPNHAGSIYSLVGTSLIFYFYFLLFQKFKTALLATNIVIVLFVIINWAFVQKDSINSYSITLHAMSILALSLFYFYHLMQGQNSRVTTNPIFWINTGMVIYSAGTLFVWILTDYLINVLKVNIGIYQGFHNSLSILVKVLYFYGVWLGSRKLFAHVAIKDNTDVT